MTQPRETNLALFIDFDNLAIGARDARQRLDIRLLIQRILEKGKIAASGGFELVELLERDGYKGLRRHAEEAVHV